MSDAAVLAPANGLPLVVQVGFAGARELFDEELHPGLDRTAFEVAVQAQFETILVEELFPLVPTPQMFICGISALAVGGDTVFTKACKHLKLQQRIFLPQPRDEFLNASGSHKPDFTPEQKASVLELLNSSHVIQERVVSVDADRRIRFHDVNLEMVRVSDILVCLVREGQESKKGGSVALIALAKKRKRPVLEMKIAVKEGKPILRHTPGTTRRTLSLRLCLPKLAMPSCLRVL